MSKRSKTDASILYNKQLYLKPLDHPNIVGY
jgi:hypothetical protein